ncbi:hypothetical protein ES705_07286 [subsurface metagenome]
MFFMLWAVVGVVAEAVGLTEVQFLIIGTISNVIIWVLRILLNKVGWQPPREVLLVFIWITGGALAIGFTPLDFPTGGFENWISFLTVQIGPIMALAWTIYQAIGKRIFDAVDDRVEALAFRR